MHGLRRIYQKNQREVMKYGYALMFVLSIGYSNVVQAQFTVIGEIRPRAEFRNGFKSPDTKITDPAFFIEQRSRLYFNFKAEKLGFKIALQDVRVWGNASQIYKTDPALTNIYEAWGEYYIKPSLSVRVGRQELDYDNARFLGDLDWAAQGRSHDAVRLMYADSAGFSFHIGAAFNQNVPFEPGKLTSTFYEGVNNYKTMQYVWVHKKSAAGKVSGLIFNNGQQQADSSTAFSQTYGIIGETKVSKIKLGGELYYQGGKDATGNDLSAWLIAANATINTPVTPLTIGIDYLSGSDVENTKNKSFNPLYGTNHKFYGFMDYFYVGNNHGQAGKTAGLIDYYLQSKIKTGAKSALIANYHHFQSPTAIYAEATQNELSSTLAEEIDLIYNLNISSDINLKVGYSQLFATKSLEALKGDKAGSGFNNWAWVMLSFKPTLFTSN